MTSIRSNSAPEARRRLIEIRVEGEQMSDAETSAYLLMAAGVFWLTMGIVGLSRGVKSKDEALEQHPEERETAP